MPNSRSLLGVIVCLNALLLSLGCRGRDSKRASGTESPLPGAGAPGHRESGGVQPGPPGPDADVGHLQGETLQHLRSGTEAEKRQAIQGLRRSYMSGAVRPEDQIGAVVDTLRGMVRNEQEPLRMEAIDLVGWLSQPGNDGYRPYQKTSVWKALPDLAAIASDAGEDEQLRAHAIDAMWFLDPEHGATALTGVLLDPAASLQLRLLSARALKWSQAGRAGLRRAVEGGGLPELVRGAAVDAVCESRSPECAALSGQPDPEVRLKAAGTLAGGGGSQYLAELRSALRDPARRAQAISAIAALRGRGAALMIEALQGPDPDLRLIAIQLLGGRLRDAAKGAVPALRRLQQDLETPEPVRTAAAAALREIGPSLPEIAAGMDGPPQARERAFGGLWMAARAMGEHAAEVMPPLRKALQDPDPRVRARAASVLGNFAIPREQASWKTASPDSALGLFRAAARDTMPDLIAALRDPDATVRGNAARAFQVLLRSQEAGGPSHAAVQALVAALQDDADPSVRQAALMALGELAFDRRLAAEDTDEARLVMAAIRRAAQDRSPDVASRSAFWVKYANAAFAVTEGR